MTLQVIYVHSCDGRYFYRAVPWKTASSLLFWLCNRRHVRDASTLNQSLQGCGVARTNYCSKGTDGFVDTCLQASRPIESSIFVSVLESCLPLHIFCFFSWNVHLSILLWLHCSFFCLHTYENRTVPTRKSSQFPVVVSIKGRRDCLEPLQSLVEY